MADQIQQKNKNISWNGLTIGTPACWEVKAIGTHHLHLEHDFQPMAEIRWQSAAKKMVSKSIERAIKQLELSSNKKLRQLRLPHHYKAKLAAFTVHCFTSVMNDEPQFLFLHEKKQKLFIMIQFAITPKKKHPLHYICKIECATKHGLEQWAIQDFRFCIPQLFTLQSHTMDAGFTTLCFKHKKSSLHLCRLAPATMRLQQGSLKEILISLLGFPPKKGINQLSESLVEFERLPSLLHQIFFRLQRKKPFIRSKMWHDLQNDRLLGVFMEATHPIDTALHDMICASYEISKAA